MIIAYASLTGKVKNFAERLRLQLPDCEFIQINRATEINDPFVLITYTWGKGDIPKNVQSFLDRSQGKILGVAGSGERNWGEHRFCKASIDISKRYDTPLIHTFEKMGYDSDVDIVASKIRDIEKG